MRLHMALVRLLRLPQVFLNNSLLLHTLTPLLFFTILVPESVEEYVFDFSAGVVLSDYVQILLGFITTDCLYIISRQYFNSSLESSSVFLILQRVIK